MDLQSLGAKELTRPECSAIGSVLDALKKEYERFVPASLLRGLVAGQLEAIRQFYTDWNNAPDAGQDVSEKRARLIEYMRSCRISIVQDTNTHQMILLTELDAAFGQALYKIVSAWPVFLKKTHKEIAKVQKRFLPGATSLRDRPSLDLRAEVIRLVRYVTKVRNWGKDADRGGLNADGLRVSEWTQSNRDKLESSFHQFTAQFLRMALRTETRLGAEDVIQMCERALAAARKA